VAPILLLLVEAGAALNSRGHRPRRDLGYQRTSGFSTRMLMLPDAASYKQLFGYEGGMMGLYNFVILCISIHHQKLERSGNVWDTSLQRKMSGWNDKLLLYGDHLVLTSANLTTLLVLMLFFFEIP
jgi:hypothetical protein